jgi:cytochrome c oxidase subunit 3
MIPYTVERRADTGVTNVTMGIWLFLASEVMLFGALFSAYALLRVSAVSWPNGRDILSLRFGATNTLTLLAMTTIVWPRRGATVAKARVGFLIATFLAFSFLLVKSFEWSDEIGRSMLPSKSTFLAMYFTLTGLHALHVIAGIVANLWMVMGARRVGDAMTMGRVRALALYWAFVDVVWIIIFVLMYLS